MTKPGFELDHVALGVARIADAAPFVAGVLGGEEHGGGPSPGFRFFQWTFAGGGRLEILEPTGPPDGFLQRFLARRGPGVHHVTFKVPGLAEAAERARAAGYDVVGFLDDDPYWKECFLHPKQAHGIVVQLAESNPDLESTDPERTPFPESPEPEGSPADILGVKLRAHSESAALRQWSTLLGGRLDPAGPVLRFRWDDSPLSIAVAIDPRGEEGPLAIEIDPATGCALPEGPHPVLGIVFAKAESES